MEKDYGFGKYVPKKRGRGAEDHEEYVQKQHLGPLIRESAKDDAAIKAGKYIGRGLSTGRRDTEIAKRIKRDVERTSKLGKPSSETRTRYFEALNKERDTYGLPPKAEGELPEKYLPKKKNKKKNKGGGRVRGYSSGGKVRGAGKVKKGVRKAKMVKMKG